MAAIWLMLCFLLGSSLSKLSVFDDSVMYALKWPGTDVLESRRNVETIIVKSKENERYRCLLPKLEEEDEMAIDPSDGPDPLSLLAPLMRQKDCSFKIEPYWIYELCHGRYLRQFHEEQIQQSNKANKVKLTEYYLGRARQQTDGGDVDPLEPPTVVEDGEQARKVTTLTIDGRSYPYYGINMTGGTPCDLQEKTARQSAIKYVCNNVLGRNEIVSLVETTTCEYEVIMATPLLCENPAYVPKEDVVNNIECHPMDGSSRYPEMMKEYHEVEIEPSLSGEDSQEVHASGKSQNVEQAIVASVPDDPVVVKQFLAGEYCLKGGSGWWHFEVCYGRYVKQFHVDSKGRTEIFLGYWDEQAHKEWYDKKISKKKRSTHFRNGRSILQESQLTVAASVLPQHICNHVLHYYAGGDVCDVTQLPRTVQVKLKCLKDASPSRVSVSLEEPLTCHYILTVEAALVCELLETADDYGLFTSPSR